MTMLSRYIFCLGFLGFIASLGKAQSDSITFYKQLDSIYVRALKTETTWTQSPFSTQLIQPSAKTQFLQNSLQEYLLESPSIFTLNTQNKAQDLRVSIRGFGSRSAFGVRGVKIIVDGIPETTPDGQGQLDNLNLGIIERIEVLNNGAASLYGNASGGVLNILTTDKRAFNDRDHFMNASVNIFSYNGQQYQCTAGKKLNNTYLIAHGNYVKGDGYRDHSAHETSTMNLRIIHDISEHHSVEGIVNYMNSPLAQDPGGITQALADSLPRSARDRNVLFNAGESIRQFKSSLRYTGALSSNLDANAYVFYSQRSFDGRLPFAFGGVIDLDRHFAGHGTSLTYTRKGENISWTSLWAYDLSAQYDRRDRFVNNEGVQGDITLSQDETFRNVGFSTIQDVAIKNVSIHAALRYDINRISTIDLLLDNGDDSGNIDLNSFNYSLGISYKLSQSIRLFSSYSTSFETPTLNELSNNPDGSGFNPSLRPQTARHAEIGIKGNKRTRFQCSFFHIVTDDELLPFEIAAFPGRTFFRNAGSTRRLGAEFFIAHPISRIIYISGNLSYHRFRFSDYTIDNENFDGNTLPGIPEMRGFAQLTIKPTKQFQLIYQHQLLGQIFFDDANDHKQDLKTLAHFSAQYDLSLRSITLQPYIGVQNLFNTAYADNIRVNAFGGRFLEPAPATLIYGGIRVSF